MSCGKGIRILSICDDEGIRSSRELVLKQEGYEVESMTSRQQLENSWVRSFHIAVLCHSLSPSRAAEIAAGLRRFNPAICVLRVHAIRSPNEHFYDVDGEVLPGPGQLLQAINTLATTRCRPEQMSAGRKRA